MAETKINPHEIALHTTKDDVASNPETRLRVSADSLGEALYRKSTIEAISALLRIRDVATSVVMNGVPRQFPRLQEALGIPDSAFPEKRGDVSAIVSVSGTFVNGDFHVAETKKMEFFRDRKKVDLPFRLEFGERMLATIVAVEDGKSDEIVGRSELFGPIDVEKVVIASVLPKPKTPPLAIGCSTCSKPLEPGERPAVEETEESASAGGSRRWKCASCVLSGIVSDGAKAPSPEVVRDGGEDPEKFDETTGPMPTT